MKKRPVVALFLVGGLVVACSIQSPAPIDNTMQSVTYRDQTIPLSRAYADFHDYRDDPNNLPAAELPRVAQLVRSAPIPKVFSSRKEADDAFFKLMFPGYGLSLLQLHDPVALYSLEIPQMEENRWVALIEKNGGWAVVDDFLWPVSSGYLNQAKYIEGQLVYLDREGKVLRVQR